MARIPLHDIFFYTAGFFLIGVLVASGTAAFIELNTQILFIILATTLIATMLWFFNIRRLLPFTAIILLGAGYYLAYDAYHQNPTIPFNKEMRVTGIVRDARHHINSQELTLENRVKIYADRYPEFNYGDRIEFTGIITRIHSPFLTGTINARFKQITLIDSGNGNQLKEKLLALRKKFERNLKEVLPHEQAAFLSGLTVGTTEEFSKEFKTELVQSGTSHITALSGSNITVIVMVIAGILGYFFTRRKIFWPTILIITLFVVMTGAESSLVRAAVMGSIFLAANHYERLPSFRNAITFAALIMIIYNPKLLAFDLGFQLSFLALLGIEYIKPMFEKKVGEIARFPFIRELFMTLSAQLAVTPLLIIKTGTVAPWSVIPNMLVGGAVPWTMGAGFITGIAGFISPLLAFFPALVASILVQYEMAVIHFFAFGG